MIRVIIEREIKPEARDEYYALIRKAKKDTAIKQGFLGSELLHQLDNPNRIVIIASWNTVDDWLLWGNSPARKELAKQISSMLLTQEKVTVLETGPS